MSKKTKKPNNTADWRVPSYEKRPLPTKKPKNTTDWSLPPFKKHPLLYWVVGFFLFIFVIAPLAQTIFLRLQILYGPRVGLHAHKEDINRGYNDDISQLKQTMQIDTTPVYSVTNNSCYKDHSDGGWMINNYYYTCSLRYVDFFDVPAVAAPYIDSVTSTLEAKEGAQDSGRAVNENDVDTYLDAIGINHSSSYDTYSISLKGNSDAHKVLALGLAVNMTVIYEKLETIHETGSSKLDPTKRYIVLSSSDQYYFNNLGCAINRPLFCFSPI